MRFVGRQTTEQILLKNKRIYREHICCAYKNIFFWINWDDKNNKTNNILLSIHKTRVRRNSKRLTYWVNFAQWIHYNWNTSLLVHPIVIHICELLVLGLYGLRKLNMVFLLQFNILTLQTIIILIYKIRIMRNPRNVIF